jgi:protein-tyrosine phosphatase
MINQNNMRKRIIPLKSVWNLRDLGGLETRQGSQIKMGLLYRSGDLSAVSGEDAAKLEKLGIKTVIDFRTDEERELNPDKLLNFVQNKINLPINTASTAQMGKTPPEEAMAPDVMPQIYRDLTRDFYKDYREFFRLVQDPAFCPILFHCSIGKDRTGFPSAILLEVLGVERETVMTDYMLSKEATDIKFKEYLMEYPQYTHILTVKPEYLGAAHKIIDTKFGGIENYAEKNLHINIEYLRSLYTE